jgi:hypothetical protein
MVVRHVNVDSVIHPYSRLEPDVHVVLLFRPHRKKSFSYEECSDEQDEKNSFIFKRVNQTQFSTPTSQLACSV